MTEAAFGRIVHAGMVEAAVKATLVKWSATYLHRMERAENKAPGWLVPIQAWRIVNDEDAPIGDDPHPFVWIVSSGVTETQRGGGGIYRAWWRCDVSVYASAGANHVATLNLARIYAAAFRTLLVQHPDLEGFSSDLRWPAEEYDRGPRLLERSVAVGYVPLEVLVDDVVTAYAGPTKPDPEPDPTQPYPDAPTVIETDAGVDALTP